jgi:hypothetical protein
MITISAFKMVPPFAQGVVRDLRVRWALEEAGLLQDEAFRNRLDIEHLQIEFKGGGSLNSSARGAL